LEFKNIFVNEMFFSQLVLKCPFGFQELEAICFKVKEKPTRRAAATKNCGGVNEILYWYLNYERFF